MFDAFLSKSHIPNNTRSQKKQTSTHSHTPPASVVFCQELLIFLMATSWHPKTFPRFRTRSDLFFFSPSLCISFSCCSCYCFCCYIFLLLFFLLLFIVSVVSCYVCFWGEELASSLICTLKRSFNFNSYLMAIFFF